MDYNYVGKTLDGRYEIQEVLGVGGMAIVYRAYDNIDDRPVAVKILKEEFLANEEFRRRFKNESKAIAMLSHPNIVKVYDVSYGERLQYIVMEYVEGITLKEYIEQRRVIPWKEAVHFLTQILRALQHAHDRGVVHRDVKPQNMMLLHSGTIKVTDFGIARFSRSETRTMSENAIGSVHYISPEQARGDFTDGKTDIYSLGVVLYEMLTGQLPFQSDSTVSVAIMQLQSEPRRPREINDQIPVGLEQITIRAMQKAPADRYQSAAEMLLDLEEFKRNPLIRFEYSFFVDREPTKYVSPVSQETRPVRPVARAATTQLPSFSDDDFEDEEGNGRNRNLWLMIGIVAGVVGLLALVVSLIWVFNNSTGSVETPSFIGMRQEAIERNHEWSRTFHFDIVPEANANATPGEVFRQDPPAGTRQRPASDGLVHVRIYIADDTARRVPDVRNMPAGEAEATLRAAGLNPRPVPYNTTRVDEGYVVRSDPAHGASATLGQMVILYVATIADPEEVEMPDLIGFDIDTAREILESVELRLPANAIERVDSHEPEDTVVWQNFDPEEMIPRHSRIEVHISTGQPAVRDADVTIPLPNRLVGSGRLTIYLDGVQEFSQVVLLNGPRSFSISGAGEDVQLQANLDGARIFTAEIDFTQDPPEVSNQRNFQEDDLSQVPNVVGMTRTEAIGRLYEAGFENVNVTFISPGVISGIFATSGTVASQNPRAWTRHDYDVIIELEVYE